MEIIYLGHSSFKIKGKFASVVTDPFDPEMVGLKYTKSEADIVTVSHDHKDHNHLDSVIGYKKVIAGPGEYEVLGVSILGYRTFHDDQKGATRGKNTIFVIEMDGFRIAHLGDLGHSLGQELLEDIGDVDILMIPVGGTYTVDAKQAAEIAKEIEPNIILPMHYKLAGLKESIDDLGEVAPFITQMGMASETLPKLVLKEAGLAQEEQKIIILEKK